MTIFEINQLTHLLTTNKYSSFSFLPSSSSSSSSSFSTTTTIPLSTSPSLTSSFENNLSYNKKFLEIQIERQLFRVIKKLSKVHENILNNEEDNNNNNNNNNNKDNSKEEENKEDKLQILQERHSKLLKFQESLNNEKVLSQTILQSIIEFGIPLNPPIQNKSSQSSSSSSSSSSTTNKKQKNVEPRKPYKIYQSSNNISIYVGRSASDNDILSLNPQHRDDNDWWLHVSGLPGSHIVIKYINDDLQLKYPQTIYEACVLAVHFSKLAQNSSKTNIEVSLTRCKYVKKVVNDPPGRVLLKHIVELIPITYQSNKYKTTLNRLLEAYEEKK